MRPISRLFLARHCPHSDLGPIYGDEINHCAGWRLQCRACGRYIGGPVSLAETRANEGGAA